MLRMSFMEHLEELRTRIIRALMGLGVAFVFSLLYAGKLWDGHHRGTRFVRAA
jgi:sec-independent protein translocase protein TatC